MAEVSSKILKKIDTLMSIGDFKDKHKVTGQAIDYAIANDLIDYVQVGRLRLIAITAKTDNYKPNTTRRRTAKISKK